MNEKWRRWSQIATISYLSLAVVSLVALAIWTGSYWWGDPRWLEPDASYFSSIGKILSSEAPTWIDKIEALLWVGAPLLCLVGAAAAAAFLVLRERPWVKNWAALGLALCCIAGGVLGFDALKQLESPVFYGKSPWVSTYKLLATPLIIMSFVYGAINVGTTVLAIVARRNQPQAKVVSNAL